MAIEKQVFCPLGKTCEEVVDGAIRRCSWYLSTAQLVAGVIDESTRSNECAIPMICVHLTELKQKTGGVQAAVENRVNKIIELAANAQHVPSVEYRDSSVYLEKVK